VTPGFVVWFTGLPGSGKSTLAQLLNAYLSTRGVRTKLLDGDLARQSLSKDLGFSKADRDEHVRRLGEVAASFSNGGGCAIAAVISPYREARAAVRQSIPRFCEVYCECPSEELHERDPKGLYEKALRGELKNFTGVDAPYEAPLAPEVHLHTERESPEASAARVLARLQELGFLAALD
jgi:adenylyl-sulfate kinase